MIGYLARIYYGFCFIIMMLLTLLPLLFGMPWREALPRSVFWAGILAAGAVFWRFRQQNLWPLFDNLRLPKYWLLGGLVGSVEGLAFLLALWL